VVHHSGGLRGVAAHLTAVAAGTGLAPLALVQAGAGGSAAARGAADNGAPEVDSRYHAADAVSTGVGVGERVAGGVPVRRGCDGRGVGPAGDGVVAREGAGAGGVPAGRHVGVAGGRVGVLALVTERGHGAAARGHAAVRGVGGGGGQGGGTAGRAE